MKYMTWMVTLTLLMLTGEAIAQETGLSKERARLQFLVGSYTTEVTMPPWPSAPKGATGKGTSVIAWGLDSAFLFIDERSENSVFGLSNGHGVLGFDLPTKQYALSMFNNAGDRLIYTGAFVGDTLQLSARIPMPGMPFDQKLLWYKEGEAIRLKVLNDIGKGFTLVLDQTARPAVQSKR